MVQPVEQKGAELFDPLIELAEADSTFMSALSRAAPHLTRG
jgi:hypothetical protein